MKEYKWATLGCGVIAKSAGTGVCCKRTETIFRSKPHARKGSCFLLKNMELIKFMIRLTTYFRM